MKTLPEIFADYKNRHIAIPAFNIDTFEIYQAVEQAVKETNLPCIVQLSPSEDVYFQAEKLYLLVKKAQLENLPIYLNMDHGKDINRLLKLALLGFDMVHFDGSLQDYQTNLVQSTEFISQIKSHNPDTLVEVEFNHINLIGSLPDPASFTHPSQAQEFLSITKADLLAISIGNMHGVSTTAPEEIKLDLLAQISQVLPAGKYLTLHGGSGIPLPQVKTSLQYGITKININTDLRLQFKHSLADSLSHQSTERIYEYMQPIVQDLAQVIKQKLISFSSL